MKTEMIGVLKDMSPSEILEAADEMKEISFARLEKMSKIDDPKIGEEIVKIAMHIVKTSAKAKEKREQFFENFSEGRNHGTEHQH